MQETLKPSRLSDWCFLEDCVQPAFERAFIFYLLNHVPLLDKLNGLDITSSVINWYACYLRGHVQVVLLNGVMSDLMDVIIGVPEGPILGPLLFTIFIKELASRHTECSLRFYADDTVLCRHF